MTASPDHLAAALARDAAALETCLDGLLPPIGGDGLGRLGAAMRYGVMGGGKRLRAFLVLEGARLCGAPQTGALRVAAALECLHAYSLVHDDLPAMDNDDLRRGKPTLHHAFDQATAILAGDALQTFAFELIADPLTHKEGAVRAELCLSLAQAAGAQGMAGGQMIDLAAEGRWADVEPPKTETAIRRLQTLKTGALIRCAAQAGAILAQDAAARARLADYGAALGLAFQIADDLLDIEGDAARAGKAVGKDAAQGKATLPRLMGIQAARAEAKRLIEAAQTALMPYGGRAADLIALAFFTINREV